MNFGWIDMFENISVEENMKVAEVERELLVTYDPNLIKEHVQKLIGRIGKYQTVFLSDKVGWSQQVDLTTATY